MFLGLHGVLFVKAHVFSTFLNTCSVGESTLSHYTVIIEDQSVRSVHMFGRKS